MSFISKEQVKNIAHMVRIEITDEEAENYTKKISSVLRVFRNNRLTLVTL